MTDRIPPEERAQKLFDDWYEDPKAMFHELVAMIEKAIAEAEARRDKQWMWHLDNPGSQADAHITAAIRARGSGEGSHDMD